MLPPNSYTQAILKRAEALRTTTSTNPPPAYTASINPPQTLPGALPPTFSIPAATFLDDPDEDLEYDDDEGLDDEPQTTVPPAPIVIKIDTGLKIEGHGNTILLPLPTLGATAASSHDVQIPTPLTTSSSQLLTPDPTPTTTTFAPNTTIPVEQTNLNTRTTGNAKLDALTTSLLSALRSAGLMDNDTLPSTSTHASTPSSTNTHSSRPIEISIDAGIKIVGSRNLITGGNGLKIVRKPGPGTAAATAATATTTSTGNTSGALTATVMPTPMGDAKNDRHVLCRKRRAESEPIEAATTKKVHI